MKLGKIELNPIAESCYFNLNHDIVLISEFKLNDPVEDTVHNTYHV